MADIHKILSNSGPYVAKDGSLGIGNLSPSQRLHLGDGSDADRGIMAIEGAGGEHLIFSEASGYSSGANAFALRPASGTKFLIQEDGASTVALSVNTNGNVGIGVGAAYKELEVIGDIQLDATDANIWIKSGATGTNGFINWTFNTNDTVYNKIGIDYDTRATTGFHIDAGYPITIDATTNIDFELSGNNQGRWNSTGLGIGTTSPDGKLDVAGNVYLANYSGTGENQTILAQNDYGQMRAGIRSGIPYIGSITSLDFALYTGNTERMRIDTSGNVGIGTTTTTVGDTATQTSTATPTRMLFNNNYSSGYTDASLKLYLFNYSTTRQGFTSGPNYDLQYHSSGHSTNAAHTFYTNNNFVMRVGYGDTTNVGIGTTSPGAKLDIHTATNSNGLLIREDTDDSITHNFYIDSADNGLAVLYADGQSAKIQLNTAGDSYFNGGNVGIGETSPTAKLEVSGNTKLGSGSLQVSTDSTFLSNYNYTFRDAVGINNPNSTSAATDSNTVMSIGAKSGGTLDTSLITTGAVGIGTSSPSQKLDVSGNIYASGRTQSANTLIGSQTISSTNFATLGSNSSGVGIAIARDHAPATYPDIIINSSGLVGIGTSSPNEKLSVNGAIRTTGATISNESSATIAWNNTPNEASFESRGKDNTARGKIVLYQAYANGTNGLRVLETDSSGNIGIGTSSPTGKLQVQTSSANNLMVGGAILLSDGITLNAINDDNTANKSMELRGTTLGFTTGGSERMRIDSSGNVMIGKDSQSGNAALTVKSPAGGNTGLILIEGDTTNDGHGLYATTDNKFVITRFTNGSYSDNFVMDSSGNVGIGTSSPSGKLNVEASGNHLHLRANTATAGKYWNFDVTSANQLYIINNGGTGMTIKDTGEVGIGTASPSFKLDINAGSNAGVFLSGSSDARYHVFSSSTANWVGYELRSSNVNSFAGGIFRNNTDNDRVSLYNKTTEAISLKDGGNVGIGVTSPGYKLDVSGDARLTAGGTAATYLFFHDTNTTYKYLAYNGDDAYWRAPGVHYFETTSGFKGAWDSTGLGIGTTSPSYKLELVGSSHERVKITSTGNATAGIYLRSENGGSLVGNATIRVDNVGNINFYNGTSSEAERMRLETDGDLHVDGDVIAYSTTVSDNRLKDDVVTIDNALDKVSKLRGVEYTWNATSRKGQKDIGVIAQEVEKVIPEIVREKEMALIDGGTYKTVDYEKLTAVLIEAVKELKAEVEELKNKCNDCTC